MDYPNHRWKNWIHLRSRFYQTSRFFLQIQNGRMLKNFVNLIQRYQRNSLLMQKLKNAYPVICPKSNLANAEIIEEKEILKQYFEPWLAFIPKPVIGGFISFLGDLTPGAKELAEKLLQTQTPDQVRTLIILDDKYENPKIFHDKKTRSLLPVNKD